MNESPPQTTVNCSSDNGLTISASVTVVINRCLSQSQLTPSIDSSSSAVTKAKRKQRSLEAIVSALKPKSIPPSAGSLSKGLTRSPVASKHRMDTSSNILGVVTPLHDRNNQLESSSSASVPSSYRLPESSESFKISPNHNHNDTGTKSKVSNKRCFSSDEQGIINSNSSKMSASVHPIKRLKQMTTFPNAYLPTAAPSVVVSQRMGGGGMYTGSVVEQFDRCARQLSQPQQHSEQLGSAYRLRTPTVSTAHRAVGLNTNGPASNVHQPVYYNGSASLSNVQRVVHNSGSLSNLHRAVGLHTNGSACLSNVHRAVHPKNNTEAPGPGLFGAREHDSVHVRPPSWFSGNTNQQLLQQHQFQQMFIREQLQNRNRAMNSSPARSCPSSNGSSNQAVGLCATAETSIHPAFALPNGYDAPIELTTQQSRERKQTENNQTSKLSRSHATITALLQKR